MAQKQRIVFMGTSGFAARILKILSSADWDMAGVYTQPDRAAGRGMRTKQSPVKELAVELGLPVYQPANFRDEQSLTVLAALKPDFLIVASYGLILPQKILDAPSIAPINVHASLLPRYRGAAPIQRAIMENWQPGAVTGVSIMRMEKGLDTGPVYARAEVEIGDKNTTVLTDVLAQVGGELLLQVLPSIADGTCQAVPQDNAAASYAAKLEKEDGKILWKQPARAVDALVRGVAGWPGAHTILTIADREAPITVCSGSIGEKTDLVPGTVVYDKEGISIACEGDLYLLKEVQPKGRQKMTSKAFANGLRLKGGIVGHAD